MAQYRHGPLGQKVIDPLAQPGPPIRSAPPRDRVRLVDWPYHCAGSLRIKIGSSIACAIRPPVAASMSMNVRAVTMGGRAYKYVKRTDPPLVADMARVMDCEPGD